MIVRKCQACHNHVTFAEFGPRDTPGGLVTMGGHLVTRGPGAQVEAGQGRGHQAGTVGVRAEAGVAPIQTAVCVSEIMTTQCPLSICCAPPARSVSPGTGSRSSPSTPSARVTPGSRAMARVSGSRLSRPDPHHRDAVLRNRRR